MDFDYGKRKQNNETPEDIDKMSEAEKILMDAIRKAAETPSVSIVNPKKCEEAKNAMSLIVAFFEASKTFPEDVISYNTYESRIGESITLRVIAEDVSEKVCNISSLMKMLPEDCNILISPTSTDKVSFEFTFHDVKRMI